MRSYIEGRIESANPCWSNASPAKMGHLARVALFDGDSVTIGYAGVNG